MDFSDKSYRERLKKVFGGHNSLRQGNFDFFFQAQVLWDEAMAETIDRFLSDNPDYQMVALAGSGHIRYGSGIPKRAFRRSGHDYSIILNDEDIDKGIGDYVLYTENLEGTTSPELGVFLTGDNGTIKVSGFTEGSAARKAGLKEGDVILSFDGYTIRSVEDLKIALFYKEKGDRAKIKVLRNGVKEQTLEIKF